MPYGYTKGQRLRSTVHIVREGTSPEFKSVKSLCGRNLIRGITPAVGGTPINLCQRCKQIEEAKTNV